MNHRSNILSIRSLAKVCFVAAIVALVACTTSNLPQANAQLPRDLKDRFESLIEDLEPELARCFQEAIDKGSTSVVFTPDEFRRFRDDPINPFEDTYKIEPDDSLGSIALNFEMPSLRNRRVAPAERQSVTLLSALNEVTADVADSVVGIWKDDRTVALGTIVSADGYIVTKASEVQKRAPVKCIINGRKLVARIERVDEENDIALLKVDATDLPVLAWSSVTPKLGSFVVTPGYEKDVVAFGTYAVKPRSTMSGQQAFLGVDPDTVESGVEVSKIRRGEASYNAGLRDGDVITQLAGKKIVAVRDLVNAIRRQQPGDVVEIHYLRDGRPVVTRATLAGRNLSGERAARFKMMNRLGAILSRRNDNFPEVFQHDAPLFPEQCGGPVVDLEGNVIGLNIARDGRASSLAIPSAKMQKIIKKLMRSNVAANR